MKAGIMCHRGCEKFCLNEVYERLGLSGEVISPGYVAITCSSYEEVARMGYVLQSAKRVLLHVGNGNITTIDDFDINIKELLEKHSCSKDIFVNDSDVLIRCERIGEHAFNSTHICTHAGQGIKLFGESIGKKLHPVFKNAQIECLVYVVDKEYAFGIDFCGFDLSKRSYKIFAHQHSIKGTMAYCALCFADMKSEECITVPFCQDGVLAIEATLAQTNISPQRYDQNKFICRNYAPLANKDIFVNEVEHEQRKRTHVSGFDPSFNNLLSSKKNAKIAGVHKFLTLSKVDSDWLFSKYIKDKADIVICHLPSSFQHRKDSPQKIYSAYFEAILDIIHDNSRIIVITTKPKVVIECAQKHFSLAKNMEVQSRASSVNFMSFALSKGNVNK